nr:hypothetical protein [uncultured Prevotella sp.]
MRHTRRGEGVPLARPEAVEGVAVVCAVARRGCCGCLNGGEVVRRGAAVRLYNQGKKKK